MFRKFEKITIRWIALFTFRGAGKSIIVGANIHIFVFCTINFFWNRNLDFKINCFYSLWTRIYEYDPPPNYRSSGAPVHLPYNWPQGSFSIAKLWGQGASIEFRMIPRPNQLARRRMWNVKIYISISHSSAIRLKAALTLNQVVVQQLVFKSI